MEQDAAFDPVALTLAIWLGLIVGVTGLVRLADDAQARAAETQTKPGPMRAEAPSPWMFAYGS